EPRRRLSLPLARAARTASSRPFPPPDPLPRLPSWELSPVRSAQVSEPFVHSRLLNVEPRAAAVSLRPLSTIFPGLWGAPSSMRWAVLASARSRTSPTGRLSVARLHAGVGGDGSIGASLICTQS